MTIDFFCITILMMFSHVFFVVIVIYLGATQSTTMIDGVETEKLVDTIKPEVKRKIIGATRPTI